MVQDNLIEMMYWLLARFETISLTLLVFTGGFSKDKWAGKYAPLPTDFTVEAEKKEITKSPSFFGVCLGYAWQAKKSSFVPSCLCGSRLLCFLRHLPSWE